MRPREKCLPKALRDGSVWVVMADSHPGKKLLKNSASVQRAFIHCTEALRAGHCHHSGFTDDETEAERLNHSPKVTQLGSNAGIWLQACSWDCFPLGSHSVHQRPSSGRPWVTGPGF